MRACLVVACALLVGGPACANSSAIDASSGGAGSGGSGSNGSGGAGTSSGQGAGVPTGPCEDGETEACYGGPPETRGIGTCVDGVATCAGGEWGPCEGDVGPATELCDQTDNSCDGVTDEGCSCAPGETLPCYSGPGGTKDVGACKGGAQACDNGTWSSVCSGEVLPGADSCNGADDDCDGETDEELGSTTCGSGKCQNMVANCAGGVPQSCMPLPGQPESCNFEDDDCDGPCDESAGCRIGIHRSYNGASGEHFYTADINEAQCCGFALEFANFYYLYGTQLAGLVPFYRCILGNGRHFYTTSSNCEGGGSVEGVLGYIGTAPSPCDGGTPLYRLYKDSPYDHFYTTSQAEQQSAIGGGYIDEGIAGYVWLSP